MKIKFGMMKTGAMFLKFDETHIKNVYEIPENLISDGKLDPDVKLTDIDFGLEPFSFTIKDFHGN